MPKQKVRLITWIGFALGFMALLSVGRLDPPFSVALGVLGVVVSVIALATSKDT